MPAIHVAAQITAVMHVAGSHADLRTHTQDGGSVRVASRGLQTMLITQRGG